MHFEFYFIPCPAVKRSAHVMLKIKPKFYFTLLNSLSCNITEYKDKASEHILVPTYMDYESVTLIHKPPVRSYANTTIIIITKLPTSI